MNILTSLQKLAGSLKRRASGRVSAGIVAALAVCATTSAQAQVNVSTLGGGPGSQDISGVGNAIITFTGGTGGGAGIKLDNPLGMAFDSSGNLYIAENAQGNILKVTNPGNRTSSFTYIFIAGLIDPVALAFAGNGDLYVLTSTDGSIRRYTSDGTFVSVITSALVAPTALTVLPGGDLVVTEIGGSVKQVTTAGVVTVLNNTFVNPTGLTLISSNRLAIADGGDNSVKILNLTNTAAITLLAGGNGAGFSNGLAFAAKFNLPRALSAAPDGSVMVADQNNNRVRIITPDGRVDTVYGVSTNSWPDNPFYPTYPGWKDGTNAHANQPFGVVVGPGATNVFVTEIGHTLDLLRVASGFNLSVSTGTNTTTTNIFVDNTVTNVLITLGFASAEGSSDYQASAGQYFQVPITLTLPLTQQIYSLGFAVAVTNVNGNPLYAPTEVGFSTKLKFPITDPSGNTIYVPISNHLFLNYVTNIVVNNQTGETTTNYIPRYTNSLITNFPARMVDVAWLEIPKAGVLYPKDQDLVTYSMAHINLFKGHEVGRVILGSFGFRIPAGVTNGAEYRVQVYNASGTEGLNRGIDVLTPTNANPLALGPGSANAVKKILIQNPRSYLVGDLEGFRWYNAGEFGNNKLEIIDVQEAFMMAAFRLNVPEPVTSDFYNTVDSYNAGSGVDPYSGNIDTVTTGDGNLTIDDVITTLRRTLDYTVKWIYRLPGGVYASNSVGVLPPDFGLSSYQPVGLASTSDSATTVTVRADDVIQAGGTINVPIRATVSGPGRPKRMMIGFLIEPMAGAPGLSEAVGYTPGSTSLIGVPNPTFTFRQGNHALSLGWIDTSGFGGVPGLGNGQNTLVTLALKPVRPLVAGEFYKVRILHYSASPGFTFSSTTQDGLVSPVSMDTISTMGDGIPDSWRYRYFGQVLDLMALKDADSDGDGIPNWAEYLAGTNPTEAKSAFKLAKPETTAGVGTTIRFGTVTGKQYVVEACDGLGNPWVQVGNVINGTDAEVVVTDNSAGAGGKFYRIRLLNSTNPAQ